MCRARDFAGALLLSGSHERAAKLRGWRGQYGITSAELRAVLQEWWTSIEAWSTPQWNQTKLAWLRETGCVSDSPRQLTGELTVYRGNLGEPEPAGVSWTLSSTEASRFALVAASSRGAFLGMGAEHRTPTVWRATVGHPRSWATSPRAARKRSPSTRRRSAASRL